MGTRAVSHIWFCCVMNVDSFAVHGTPVVTPVSTFFNSHLANSKLVKPISCQAKLDAFLIIIIISSPAGEALNEESFHFQFTTFSHFREKKKNIPRCSYFLVCATVFIPLIPSSLGLFFILFLLCTTDVFCLSPIFPTQREDKYQREGKTGSMKMPFSFALLSLFSFSSCCCSVSIIHIECPVGGVRASPPFSQSRLIFDNIFWTHTILVVIINWQTCWFDMSNPLWDVKEAGKMGV